MSGFNLKYLGAVLLAAFTIIIPIAYYRLHYNYSKRFRVVTPGRVYRSGQLTAAALAEAIRQHQIRTVINVQNELPNPDLGGIDEATWVQQLGAKYVFLEMDLIDRRRLPVERPTAVAAFLQIMDDPANYPVLIHCRAGLHRTGTLVALYRLEYEGASIHEVLGELISHGFSPRQATARNDYIQQYLLTHQPRSRPTSDQARNTPALP